MGSDPGIIKQMRKYLSFFILRYLHFFAKIALAQHKPTIIGITGTVGKSSVRNALQAILKTHYNIKSIGNSETGIPLDILGVSPHDYSVFDWLRMIILIPFGTFGLRKIDYLIAEMGIDDPYPPKNMSYLLTIIKPDIAIVLNVGPAHTMQFEKLLQEQQKNLSSEEQQAFLLAKIAQEKTKIITQSDCKIGIYNADDKYIKNYIEEFKDAKPTTNILSFGKKDTNTLSYGEYAVSLQGSGFTFFIDKAPITVDFPHMLLPLAYQEVLGPAIMASLQCNLSLEQITTALEKHFILPHGRASIVKGINNTTIIDSSYNASKPAVMALLDLAHTLKKQTKRPLVFLYGDMRELGGQAKAEHEAVAALLPGLVDYLYCVGPLTMEYVLPIVDEENNKFREIKWFDTSPRVGNYLKEHLPNDALVLVKGSQNQIFLEEAIKPILENKEDKKLLCRQEDFWLKKKRTFFTSLEVKRSAPNI